MRNTMLSPQVDILGLEKWLYKNNGSCIIINNWRAFLRYWKKTERESIVMNPFCRIGQFKGNYFTADIKSLVKSSVWLHFTIFT